MSEALERITLGSPDIPKYTSEPHIAAYEFASKWVTAGKTVLDLACGTGYGVQRLERASAGKIIGVDYSREAVRYARAHFGNGRAGFIIGDGLRCGLRDDAFDLIICLQTVEHVPDAELFLTEMTRVLKDDGTILISTPNKVFYSPDAEKPLNPYHVVEFTLETLQQLLSNHFAHFEVFGQQPQHALVKATAKRWAPPAAVRRLLLMLPFVRSYFASNASVFVSENVDGCRSFLAVCSSQPQLAPTS